MQRLARVLWVWLFAAALPLQGVAAGAMQACGVRAGAQRGTAVHAGHVAVVRAAMPMAHEADGIDGRLLAHPPCHGHPDQGHAGAAQPCSVCAACSGQTPMSMPIGTARCCAIAVADAFAPFTAQAPPAFLTSGIERPPKRTSA